MSNDRKNSIICILILLICLSPLYIYYIGNPSMIPVFALDQALYLTSAKSISEGNGYRLANYPHSPVPKYGSVGYPAILAIILSYLPLDTNSVQIMQYLNVCFSLGWLILTFLFLQKYLSSISAFLVTLFTGVMPQVVYWGTSIVTEASFCFFMILTFFCHEKLKEIEPKESKKYYFLILGISLSTIIAFYIRPIAVTFIIAILIGWSLEKKWRQIIFFGLICFLLYFPWQIWLFFNASQGAGNYLSYVSKGYSLMLPISQFLSILTYHIPNFLYPYLDLLFTGQVPLSLEFRLFRWGLGGIGFLLFFVGLIEFLRKRELIAIFLLVYVFVVINYPFPMGRYMIPLIPFWLLVTVTGLKTICKYLLPENIQSGIKYSAVVIILTFIGISCAATIERANKNDYHAVLLGWNFPQKWENLEQTYSWIKRTTPPNTLLITPYENISYLFTDRQTALTVDIHSDLPTLTDEKIKQIIADIADNRPIYLVVMNENYLGFYSSESFNAFSKYAENYSNKIEKQWVSKDNYISIYKINR